ncbi:MAG: hypothetical protein ACJA2Q_002685 [Pseudohongiellaceae bacterium]|jgi:hypothetical protein
MRRGTWHIYCDATCACSYTCIATEYFYCSPTSILATQDYQGHLIEIQHQWSSKAKAKILSAASAEGRKAIFNITIRHVSGAEFQLFTAVYAAA